MAISDYQHIQYRLHGREAPFCDCWGFVRLVWQEHFKKPALPMLCGLTAGQTKGITTTYREMQKQPFKLVQIPYAGVLVVCMQASLCTHIGIVVSVDDRLFIMDCNEGANVSLHNIKDFERKFTKVLYYDNQHI